MDTRKFFVTFIAIFLLGCTSEIYHELQHETDIPFTTAETEQIEAPDTAVVPEEENFTMIIPREGSNGFKQVDLRTSELTAKTDIFDYFFLTSTQFENGYFGAFARGPVPESGWDEENWIDSGMVFFLFDTDFDHVRSYEITGENLIRYISFDWVALDFTDDILKIYYFDAWGENGFYVYYPSTNENRLIYANDGFSARNLQWINSNTLFFESAILGDEHPFVGIFDLFTLETTFIQLTQQNLHSHINGNYVVFTEMASGELVDFQVVTELTGRIDILSLESMALFGRQLSPSESQDVIVMENRFLFATTENYVTKYDLHTGEVLFAKSHDFDTEIQRIVRTIFPVNPSYFAITFSTLDDVRQTKLFYVGDFR